MTHAELFPKMAANDAPGSHAIWEKPNKRPCSQADWILLKSCPWYKHCKNKQKENNQKEPVKKHHEGSYFINGTLHLDKAIDHK